MLNTGQQKLSQVKKGAYVMNRIVLIALSIISVVIGISIELLIPKSIGLSGWMISIILVISLLVFTLTKRQGLLSAKFDLLKDNFHKTALELANIKAELSEAQEKLNNPPENDQVASEIRMLRTLMKQFANKLTENSNQKASNSKDSIEIIKELPNAKDPPSILHEPILNYTDSEILKYLEKAVREDRIELYLQPIVKLPQRTKVFFECFSRITDDKSNIIRPEQYLPIANAAGLTAAVDNLLLFRCIQLVRRTRRDQPDIAFFCNISKSTLTDVEFFTDFIDFMSDNTQLTSSLIFEFSQSTLLDPNYEIQIGLQRLSKLGFRLSLDQLHELDVDLPKLASQGFKFIKINAHLLHEIARGNTPDVNMKALKGALDREAMDLIVEKIETEEMLLDLLDLKIDFGQGYLFGAPQPLETKNQ
jgi:cyclic-di-GMP phosphodiesterase TipF (flagellum assembly factor)